MSLGVDVTLSGFADISISWGGWGLAATGYRNYLWSSEWASFCTASGGWLQSKSIKLVQEQTARYWEPGKHIARKTVGSGQDIWPHDHPTQALNGVFRHSYVPTAIRLYYSIGDHWVLSFFDRVRSSFYGSMFYPNIFYTLLLLLSCFIDCCVLIDFTDLMGFIIYWVAALFIKHLDCVMDLCAEKLTINVILHLATK